MHYIITIVPTQQRHCQTFRIALLKSQGVQ